MATDFRIYINNSNNSFSDIEKLSNSIGLPMVLGSKAQFISTNAEIREARINILNYNFFLEHLEEVFERLSLTFESLKKRPSHERLNWVDNTTPKLTKEFYSDEVLSFCYNFDGFIGNAKVEFIVNKLVEILNLSTNDMFITYTIGDSDYILLLERLDNQLNVTDKAEVISFQNEELQLILEILSHISLP